MNRGPRRTCSLGWLSGIFARRGEPLPPYPPQIRHFDQRRSRSGETCGSKRMRPQISQQKQIESVLIFDICGRIQAGSSTTLRFAQNDKSLLVYAVEVL